MIYCYAKRFSRHQNTINSNLQISCAWPGFRGIRVKNAKSSNIGLINGILMKKKFKMEDTTKTITIDYYYYSRCIFATISH